MARDRGAFARGVCVALALSVAPAAMAVELTAQTRIRLTVVQWMPLAGQYERWDALGGELIVSPEGDITVPIVGPVPVAGKSPQEVASEVGELLRSKLGLVETPGTSIEIIEFPPVYVIGSVTAPGAFPYRPGMTVLQALALAGDRLRTPVGEVSAERIELVAELRSTEEGLLRGKARLARLAAEFAEAEAITFPEELTDARTALAQEIMTQEQAIFTARANGLARQAVALTELSDLLAAEIETLEARVASIDETITSTEVELVGITSLVEQGVVTVARQSELQRLLSATRVDRLDQLTAILRARQGLSEAERDAVALRDERRTEVAQQLQETQAEVERLTRQQLTTQELLLQLDLDNPVVASAIAQAELQFTIVRKSGDGTLELAAADNTPLIPGDVLKVTALPLVSGPGLAEAD